MCSACAAAAPKWAGRCGSCGEWNTLVETVPAPPVPGGLRQQRERGRERRGNGDSGSASDGGSGWPSAFSGSLRHAVLLSAVEPESSDPVPTGIAELDRVLSGGLVPGSVTLVGGEPGIGKSTLLLQAAASAAQRGGKTLLVVAEESAEQVRRRAERLGALVDGCYVVATADLQTALEAVGRLAPDLVVVDSIQTIGDRSLTSPVGSVTQVRECAQALAHYAKATQTATVIVGHVTKDGVLAGPRTLEHLVDTVLSFDGDRHHSLRHLSATKHRYGTTGEIGLFEMGESGLIGLLDPSAVLLADRRSGIPGAVVTPVIEGRRPLLVEVQALVGDARSSTRRRVAEGLPAGRLALLLAVLERSVDVSLATCDVFVSTVGGIRVAEPACDVAVALALVSAATGLPIEEGVVAFGEIGLGGEIRRVPAPARRLAEAGRLGFGRAVAPIQGSSNGAPGAGTIEVVQVATIAGATAALGLAGARPVAGRRNRAGALMGNARSGARGRGEDGKGCISGSHRPRPARDSRTDLSVVRD